MTLEELRRRILNSLNDSPDAPVFWSKSEIDDYIRDAMEMLAEESEGLKRVFTVPRRAGTMIYHLDGIGEQIMVPYRIWLPDLSRRLESWSITDLDARHETWMTVTGEPWVWWSIDWQHFGIWPVPASAGGWMEIDCYVWPDELLASDHRPEFMPADHEALVQFAVAEGYLKQHMVSQALNSERDWARKWGRAGTRSSIEQMSSAFHNRGLNDGDHS